jgi:hypothetical protein
MSQLEPESCTSAPHRSEVFLAEVAQRDTSILEMASNHSGYDGWRGGVEFQADAAALRARRIVGVMLAKEAGGFGDTSRTRAEQ